MEQSFNHHKKESDQSIETGALFPVLSNITSYEAILAAYGFVYVVDKPRLLVRSGEQFTGWILHLSVIRQQAKLLFIRLLPFLRKNELWFDIPQDSSLHEAILDGGYGYDQIGKIINIYADNPSAIDEIVQFLITITEDLAGPEIVAAYHLSNCLYASYRNADSGMTNHNYLEKTSWPFKGHKRVRKKVKKWLNRKYFITQNLKGDSKGNVYKGLNLSKWTDISWCIIKQGRCNQCVDDAGRSIADRLQWQFEVQSSLSKIINIPTAVDLIEQDGDTFFVMEFIDGKTFNNHISAIQEGKVWDDLETEKKINLIQLLIQVIDLVDGLHSNGYLHRDLSPENFIVATGNKLYAIDIELSYDKKRRMPNPFFTLGTEGYLSPDQRKCHEPRIEDDIYGIGGLIIRTITGLSPTKFATLNGHELFDSLSWFVTNQRILLLICQCWENDPNLRPSLKSLKHNFNLYHSILLTNELIPSPLNEPRPKISFDKIFNDALNSLWKGPLISETGTWYSKTIIDDAKIGNEFIEVTWYPGFYTGVAGILYLLSVADPYGYDLGNNRAIYYHNFELLRTYFERDSEEFNGSLFYGRPGFALLMASMINHDQLEKSLKNTNFISKLLIAESSDLNLANGICGIGLAMMQIQKLLRSRDYSEELGLIAERVLKAQNSDGSWIIKQNSSDKKGIKIFSLYHGIAGIILFLIHYGQRYNSSKAVSGAHKGLQYLLTQKKEINGSVVWPVNSKSNCVEPWVEYGFSGISYLFIQAFEVYQDLNLKDIAIRSLQTHPQKITSNYFSQATGVAGLGEVYLEAYRVFNDRLWLDRAMHISDFLLHTAKIQDPDFTLWLDGSEINATANFMTGQSGILHFLLRCKWHSKITFPLLSI